MHDGERDERIEELTQFANAEAQRNQPIGRGAALVRPTSGIAERIVGAQPVAVRRDEKTILDKLRMLGAAAGSDWFYRFPVRKKEGGQDWIEGPSIKLANDVARIFGNNVNEVREIDVGDAWVFYARFTDIETGFSMERAYRQRKSQASMRTRDTDRQLDIAYQIGQSKAIRNCIVNSLQIYADYAFEQARDSLVDKIGKNLEGWRKRTLERLAEIPVELPRVERVLGRSAKEWLAPNIAQIVAMVKSIADGMATVDEVFPTIEAASPAGDTSAAGEQGGAQGQSTADASAAHKPADDPAAATYSTDDVIATAYRRGIGAKDAGHLRKALPLEYRNSDNKKNADAWLAGFDGKSMPDEDDSTLV